MNPNYKTLAENHYQIVEILVDKMLAHPSYSFYKSYRADLIGEGSIALVKAAKRFDESRGIKFSTFVSKNIKGAIKNVIGRKISPHSLSECDIDSIDPNELVAEEPEEEVDEVEDNRIDVHDYAPTTDLQKIVYYKVIIGKTTPRELAEEINVSVATIYKLRSRILEKLKQYSKVLNRNDYYNLTSEEDQD